MPSKDKKNLAKKKIMIVFGSGGHTTEMLLMLKTFDFETYGQVYFVLGHSDTWSLTKIKDYFLQSKNTKVEDVKNLTILRLFRSREVKQSYLTSVFTTLMGLAHSLGLVAKIRPDIVSIIVDKKIIV
jgi:beta-1,4-N-acetylglucosaminyltransferase